MLDPGFKAACDEVVRLIKPEDPPHWLADYFAFWATPVAQEIGIRGLQRTRSETREKLAALVAAADTLSEAVGDVSTWSFLARSFGPDFAKEFTGLHDSILSLRKYALLASKSPALSTAAGKTKSGRGKTLLPGTHNPKMFCALVVSEAWKFLHGKYPMSKNRKAAAAALAYWEVSGRTISEAIDGTVKGWGSDPLGAWRPYFEKAQSPEVAPQRAECLRILQAIQPQEDRDRDMV